ncbi:MAG: macro domain-containing protein [Limisphaerales bacterium]
MRERIEICRGDITRVEVDAIVNAANTSLLGGGGVVGDIHREAGPGLVQECRRLNGCATGSAEITDAYELPAKRVIHAVGPIWRDGTSGEADQLANTYRACFRLLREHSLISAAFPCISTGAYRFPIPEASRIALREACRALQENVLLRRVLFVCFDDDNRRAYEDAVEEHRGRRSRLKRFFGFPKKDFSFALVAK